MTVKLPEKAGFVPTVAEWDQLVRIAENLAAQLAQAQAERDAAQRDLITLAENWHASEKALDAARAEVARLTADVDRMADMLRVCECGHHAVAHEGRRFFCNMKGCECAALRQPAPAQPLDDDGVCKCGHARGQHRGVCMIFPCKCMEFTAPAQGQE